MAVLGFPGGSRVKNPPANTGDMGLIPGLGRSPGEGSGNPLQYSSLENPMDRGAWRAPVHGVTKSQTRLSNETTMYPSNIISPFPIPLSSHNHHLPLKSLFYLLIYSFIYSFVAVLGIRCCAGLSLGAVAGLLFVEHGL